jgi:hypothetical protein
MTAELLADFLTPLAHFPRFPAGFLLSLWEILSKNDEYSSTPAGFPRVGINSTI